MSEATDVKDTLLKALRNLTIATIVAYVLLASLGAYVFWTGVQQSAELGNAIETTNGALCAFRGDIERRVEASEQFLEDNPDGIPGLSAAVIERGLASQRDTIESLGELDCGPVPP